MRKFTLSLLIIAMFAARLAAQSGTVTTLVDFQKNAGEGPFLESLVQGKDGNLYGTATSGGASNIGTVFKVNTTGKLILLHTFSGADGKYPESGLIMGVDGSFYGMTNQGGSNSNYGTVFKLTRTGALTTLHAFNITDGAAPTDALTQGADGNFYGTASEGGNGNGTIFKMTPLGHLTTIHEFDGTDGTLPDGSLIQGIDGNFYGTAQGGGANSNAGTVFKVTSDGALSLLYNFCAQANCGDGSFPAAGLVQGSDGNFYGTTMKGGGNNDGTVFKITPGGGLTTLYSFCSQSGCPDGYYPQAALIQGTDGNFYGTTAGYGKGYGTIFQITSGGSLTTLYNFTGSPGGSYPYGGLVQHTNGTFYGVTDSGGRLNYGTLFSLSMGLGPFVKLVSASGKVGATITVLGTNLTGVSSVTFNGTPASFKAPTSTYLTVTVPVGATSGFVQAVTSAGTLQSNVQFNVLQ